MIYANFIITVITVSEKKKPGGINFILAVVYVAQSIAYRCLCKEPAGWLTD